MFMWDSKHPLWLPEGSVRAIIALSLVAAYIAGLVDFEVLGPVVGFYFGAKAVMGARD